MPSHAQAWVWQIQKLGLRVTQQALLTTEISARHRNISKNRSFCTECLSPP